MKKLSFDEKVSDQHRENVFSAVNKELEKNAQLTSQNLKLARRNLFQNIFWFLGVASSVSAGLVLWLRQKKNSSWSDEIPTELIAVQNIEMMQEQDWIEDLDLIENLDVIEGWEEV